MAEAYLTHERVYDHFYNNFINATINDKLKKFMDDNAKYIREKAANPSDDFWYQVSCIIKQEEGFIEGYNKYKNDGEEIDNYHLKYMMYWADVSDILSVTANELPQNDHCSALIKVLEDNSDIFIAQNAWYHYESMTRIWKVYDFPFKVNANSNDIVPGRRMSMASYPSYLFSFDDFYLLSSGFVVQETTIGNNNKDLLSKIIPESVSVYMRTMTANRLSTYI